MLRESLKTPLQDLSDPDLVLKIQQENSSDAVSILHERHSPLVVNVAKKYSSSVMASGISIADFAEESPYLIYKAASNYDPNRGTKFSTHLANTTRYHCLNAIEKHNKYANMFEDNALDYAAEKVADFQEPDRQKTAENTEFVMFILDQLSDERAKAVVRQRYLGTDEKNRSFESIGVSLDMSTQGVINLHNRALDRIRKTLDSETCLDRI